MEKRKLHIVSLDVPFPADYGGAIDIFYRVKALHALGFDITLHVFEYGRGKQEELNKYAKVIYYPRNKSIFHLFSSRPFIVQSRKSAALHENLRKDKAPILFEGIHTTWYLEQEDIQKRLTLVRMHNVEDEYYRGLKKNASFLKKLYFQQETIKLKKYQSILAKAKYVLCIKEEDATTLKKHNPNVLLLPASIPDIHGSFTKVKRYSLFHGNLSVPENEQAAIWIMKTLHSVLDPSFPFIIAGKNPSKKLASICEKYGVKLIPNPSERTLDELIQEAQIHVLYTTVPSGVKLKLLSCIHSSGRILVNDKMVNGTGLEKFCKVAIDAKEFKLDYLGLQLSPVLEEEFKERAAFISKYYNTKNNCRLIEKLIVHDTHA